MASNVGSALVDRAYSIKSSDEAKALYDQWASTYDTDLVALNYISPTHAAQTVVQVNGNAKGTVLDAGCGTGLCGVALAKLGADTIDGNDISQGMLEMAAKTGVYRQLKIADLGRKLDVSDETYDVVTCVGTLTHGHVAPTPALGEFVRITRRGGVIVGTVHEDIWESGGYLAEALRLCNTGVVELVGSERYHISEGAEAQVRMMVLKKL